jgi:hypothetical protein
MNSPATAAAMSRQRISVWAETNFLFVSDAMVSPAQHAVDDISLLITVTNTIDASTPIQPVLDTSGFRPESQMRARIPVVIRRCHRHQIQCLAGYKMDKESAKTKRFKAWLDQLVALGTAARTAEIGRYAKALVELVLNPFQTTPAPTPFESFDGISFDFEDVPLGKGKVWAPVLVELYRAVAKRLEDPTGDRIVAVAAGGMVSEIHTHFHPGVHPKSLRNANPAMGSMVAHSYAMANGARNLIVRPMAYDNFTIKPPTPASTVREWHEDVTSYAIGAAPGEPVPPAVASISRKSFQLGIKYFPGTSNKPPPGRNLDSILSHPEIQDRCKYLRKRGVGLVLFAYPRTIVLATGATLFEAGSIAQAFWAKVHRYNFVLNGPVDASGEPDFAKFDEKNPTQHTIKAGLATGPDQVPLGNGGVARLTAPSPTP